MGMLPHTAFGDLEEAKFTAKDKASYGNRTCLTASGWNRCMNTMLALRLSPSKQSAAVYTWHLAVSTGRMGRLDRSHANCSSIPACVLSTAIAARPTSIHHWQLRDLISPADNEHQFYCVHEEAVYCYNAKARQSSIISNLDFSPNSMTCSMGFIAAGGTHGEVKHSRRQPRLA